MIEAVTYRLGAHSTSDDPRLYRDESEVEKWTKRDPILRFKKVLEKKKLWNSKKEEDLNLRLQLQITQAIEEAEKLPLPPSSSLFEDVYRENPLQILDQAAQSHS